MKSFLAAVVGYPVTQSLSPEIFEWMGKKFAKEISYQKLTILPESFESEVNCLSRLNGCNITAPFKEKIFQWLKDSDFLLSHESQMIGAANVIKKISQEKEKILLKGYNTDCEGMINAYQELHKDLKNQEVLLFGAGGAALASTYALGKMGAQKVWITNRNSSKSIILKENFCRLFPHTEWNVLLWENILTFNQPIVSLIQATSLGMASQPGSVPLPLEYLSSLKDRSQIIAFDLIYKREETEFLKNCKNLGLTCIEGIDLLVWQAIATWEIWFDSIENNDFKLNLKKELKNFLIQKNNESPQDKK